MSRVRDMVLVKGATAMLAATSADAMVGVGLAAWAHTRMATNKAAMRARAIFPTVWGSWCLDN